MKVRVSFTVEVDDDFRRSINYYYARPGLASREDIKAWYEDQAGSVDADCRFEWKMSLSSDLITPEEFKLLDPYDQKVINRH